MAYETFESKIIKKFRGVLKNPWFGAAVKGNTYIISYFTMSRSLPAYLKKMSIATQFGNTLKLYENTYWGQ